MSMLKYSLFKQSQILLPHRKRRPRFTAWIKVSVSFIASIIDTLFVFWENSCAEARMTPQVIYIERFLRNRYGVPDIYISEGFTLGPWIFTKAETADPEFYMDLANSYVYGDYDAIVVDFIVNIPSSLILEVQTIAAMVSKYKLIGKYFIIQIN